MKDVDQETQEKNNKEVNSKPSIAEKESFEDLYVKERKKAQVFLISTAVFLALFLISTAYGLRVSGQDDRGFDGMRPQGTMQGGHYGRQGRNLQNF